MLISGLPVSFSEVASLEKTFSKDLEGSKIAEMDIENFEQMKDYDGDCGSEKKTANPAFKFVGKFHLFETMFDNCNTLSNVAQYKVKTTGKKSYSVIGFEKKLGNAIVKSITGKRTPSKSELAEVSKQKSELRKLKSDLKKDKTKCFTVPQFIDSAERMYEVDFTQSSDSLVLSRYQNPGCMGHLSTVYILDIFRKQQIVQTVVLTEYVGNL